MRRFRSVVVALVVLAACQSKTAHVEQTTSTSTTVPETTTTTATATTITQPVSTASTDVTSLPQTEPGGHSCGVERWFVKTGTDPEAAQVDTANVHDSTVAEMTAIAAPHSPTTRVAPVETTVYRLHATITAYRTEKDSDVHLVLSDDAGRTMIAEIPSSGCMGSSPFVEAVRQTRSTFDARFPESTSFRVVNTVATLTGVGFFDFKHGQRGVAPNAIELHPLLSISFS